jgi:hypothetical protein
MAVRVQTAHAASAPFLDFSVHRSRAAASSGSKLGHELGKKKQDAGHQDDSGR